MKKNQIIIIISIGLALLLLVVGYLVLFAPKDISSYKDSVVQIIAYDENYIRIGTGSGVAAIANDVILTNAHVIEDAQSIEIMTNNKDVLKVSGIQYINYETDVAIIKLSEPHSLKLLATKTKASEGTSVYAIGYSLGILNAISDGIISSIEDMDQFGSVYSHTAPISEGNSGGALLNKRGQLIGINFASYTYGQNMNLAIKIEKYINAYNMTKNDEPISFELSSISSTKYFSTENGRKLLGEFSSNNFDYFWYEVAESEGIKHFAENQYNIAAASATMDDKIQKIMMLSVLEMKEYDDQIFNDFKTFVKEYINDINYNSYELGDLDFKYYWNCDNDYCYILSYYNIKNIDEVINFINNTNNNAKPNGYEEKSSGYIISPSKVVQEAVPEKPAYTETIIRGKNIAKTTKDRLEVGVDVMPGKYDIVVNGYAPYQIYIGAVIVNLNYQPGIYMDPYSKTNCYFNEQNCGLLYNSEYFKRIKNIELEEGDILRISYPSHRDQSESLQFVALSETITHEAVPAIEEIVAPDVKVKETIRKYKNNTQCFINNYKVNKCEVLFDYDKIASAF